MKAGQCRQYRRKLKWKFKSKAHTRGEFHPSNSYCVWSHVCLYAFLTMSVHALLTWEEIPQDTIYRNEVSYSWIRSSVSSVQFRTVCSGTWQHRMHWNIMFYGCSVEVRSVESVNLSSAYTLHPHEAGHCPAPRSNKCSEVFIPASHSSHGTVGYDTGALYGPPSMYFPRPSLTHHQIVKLDDVTGLSLPMASPGSFMLFTCA